MEEVVPSIEDFGVCDLLDSLGITNNFPIDLDIFKRCSFEGIFLNKIKLSLNPVPSSLIKGDKVMLAIHKPMPN